MKTLGSKTVSLGPHTSPRTLPNIGAQAPATHPRGFSFLGSSFVETTCWREPSIRWWPIPGRSSSETSCTSPLLERRGEPPALSCRHLSAGRPEPPGLGWFSSRSRVTLSFCPKVVPIVSSQEAFLSRCCQSLNFMFSKSLRWLVCSRIWGHMVKA